MANGRSRSTGPKVCVVGAGSASFGLSVLKGLLYHPGTEGLHIHLHDIDSSAVSRVGGLGQFLASEGKLDRRVTWGTDPDEALDGAGAVVISIAIDRDRCWLRDRELALKYGINHYAENGGPAAIFHAGRNIAQILPLLRHMEAVCPDALVINYTNPVPRICTAIRQASKLKFVGVCHQIEFGYYIAAVLLSAELGIRLPPDYRFRWTDLHCGQQHWLAALAREKIEIEASGLNHFTWAQSVRLKSDGTDLYPLLREKNRTFDRTFEPLTRRVFDIFDLLPVPGDTHLSEYLPYTHNTSRGTFARYDIQMYDFDWAAGVRQQRAALCDEVISHHRFELMEHINSERVEQLVEGALTARPQSDDAVNTVNKGAIPGLPDDAVVEAPAVMEQTGPKLLACQPLPAPIIELCRRQVLINELSVAGMIERDRHKLLQALALDPMVDDPDLPDQLLDDYFREFDAYLTS